MQKITPKRQISLFNTIPVPLTLPNTLHHTKLHLIKLLHTETIQKCHTRVLKITIIFPLKCKLPTHTIFLNNSRSVRMFHTNQSMPCQQITRAMFKERRAIFLNFRSSKASPSMSRSRNSRTINIPPITLSKTAIAILAQ